MEFLQGGVEWGHEVLEATAHEGSEGRGSPEAREAACFHAPPRVQAALVEGVYGEGLALRKRQAQIEVLGNDAPRDLRKDVAV